MTGITKVITLKVHILPYSIHGTFDFLYLILNTKHYVTDNFWERTLIKLLKLQLQKNLLFRTYVWHGDNIYVLIYFCS